MWHWGGCTGRVKALCSELFRRSIFSQREQEAAMKVSWASWLVTPWQVWPGLGKQLKDCVEGMTGWVSV